MIYLKRLKRHCNTLTLRIASLLTIVAIISYTEVMERIDFVIYDVVRIFQLQVKDTDLIIIAIDNESIRNLGGWPWSRGVHAELINRLTAIGKPATAFDLLFSELHASDPMGDQLLSEAIAAHGNIIFPAAPVSADASGFLTLAMPHPLFSRNIMLGHTDIELDSDAVTRRVFLHAGIDSPSWSALGLALAEKSFPEKIRPATANPKTKTPVRNGRFWVRSGETLIPFSGKPGSFPHISYSRVLFDDGVLAGLKDKTIIIGMTATGMGTRFATPASLANRQPMTGVEWHANVYSMIQHNRMIHPVSNTAALLISISWIALLLAVTSTVKKHLTVPLLLAILFLTLMLVYLLLQLQYLWIPPGAALLGVIAFYPLWNWHRINQFLRLFLINKIQSSTALETIVDGVIIMDASDHVIYINRGAENILRTQLNQVTGKLLRQIVNTLPTQADHFSADQFPGTIPPEPGLDIPGTLECQIKTTLGDRRNVRITRSQLHDEQRMLIGSVISMTDITDTVRLAQRVAYQEEYDALTKLPNRSKLLSRFDQLIGSAQDMEKTITVFFVTLDNFKKINDAMGHQAGDKLLRTVSWRLNKVINHKGVLARWGGDEFIILQDNLSDTLPVTETAQEILNAIGQAFDIDGMKLFVSASIGISFYPQDGMTSDLVLEKAGTAMYQAKHKGGNRFDLYSPQSSVIWTRDRLELEKDLRTAIEHDELQVFFQPIVNATSHHISRIEALVRWQHPKRGFLSPSEFVPLAENIGLIEQLGERVLSISCLSTNQLLRAGYPMKVSVNVNPRQLTNSGFLDMVFKTLHDTGLPASALMLEITENAVVNNTERASEILEQIKAVGILIALDDFGTGYSSLTLLRELPIDILKIDKSFVRTLDRNQNDQKIVQAIIGLGANLGLTVVAEGVETEQQSQMLLQHHCRYQQGYFFSRPIPYSALLELVTQKASQRNI